MFIYLESLIIPKHLAIYRISLQPTISKHQACVSASHVHKKSSIKLGSYNIRLTCHAFMARNFNFTFSTSKHTK